MFKCCQRLSVCFGIMRIDDDVVMMMMIIIINWFENVTLIQRDKITQHVNKQIFTNITAAHTPLSFSPLPPQRANIWTLNTNTSFPLYEISLFYYFFIDYLARRVMVRDILAKRATMVVAHRIESSAEHNRLLGGQEQCESCEWSIHEIQSIECRSGRVYVPQSSHSIQIRNERPQGATDGGESARSSSNDALAARVQFESFRQAATSYSHVEKHWRHTCREALLFTDDC